MVNYLPSVEIDGPFGDSDALKESSSKKRYATSFILLCFILFKKEKEKKTRGWFLIPFDKCVVTSLGKAVQLYFIPLIYVLFRKF